MDILFLDHRDYLRSEFGRRTARNSRYSLRAFARDLKLSPSTLSEILKGKYGLERKRALDVAEALSLDAANCEHFADLFEAKFHKNESNRRAAKLRIEQRQSENKSTISLDAFQVISEWYHLAILELVGIAGAPRDEKGIARRLALPKVLVEEAVARLLRLGLLEKTSTGFRATEEFLSSGNQVPSLAIRNFHGQILNKAMQALDFQSVQEREFSSTIFSIDRDRLGEAKADLRRLRLDFANKFTATQKQNDVYCLSIQLFSLLEKENEQ